MRDEVERRTAGHGGSMESVLPKVIGLLLAIGLIKVVIGHGRRHGGSSDWRERRRAAIAEFHRELHAEDAA